MSSVTNRIKQIKQPRGGYIPVSMFTKTTIVDNAELKSGENLHPSLVGLAVDYLSRFRLGTDKVSAFKISLMGAKLIKEEKYAQKLLDSINGLDDKSIVSAIRLSGFDVCCRAGIAGYRPVQDIMPNENTIKNIKLMVERSISFFDTYGPVILDGFNFVGGYTDIITTGDGDFTTDDTLWDFKVSVNEPTKDHTLQLLIYYIMGNHSIHDEFENISKLGIFNPRLNTVYILPVVKISREIIKEVEQEIIGYRK